MRVGQYDPCKFLHDILKLGSIGFEEFPPGRNIVKKVLYTYACPFIAGSRLLRQHLGTFYYDMGTQLVLPPPGLHLHLRYGRYGSKGLTTEAHSSYGEQVFYLPDLGSGMPFKAHPRVHRRHAFPVVHHLDQLFPGILYNELYVCCAGINSIFHQLLYRGGRALYHLSCCNLVR